MTTIAYHRPATLEEALELLQRPSPPTVPLGGGSWLNQPGLPPVAVVDLQSLNLNQMERKGQFIHLGATVTLQEILEHAGPDGLNLPPDLAAAVRHEASINLRQVATLAGTLVAAGGRSPLATAFLALDAALRILPGDDETGLGDLLPMRHEVLRGRLITSVSIPAHARLAYEYIARTPADQPIVCAAAATWPSGRLRLALGGYAAAPLLAFDGSEPDGIEMAAQSAFYHAADMWASAEYRQEMAGILARRCLEKLSVINHEE